MAKFFLNHKLPQNCGKIFACEKKITTIRIMKKDHAISTYLGITQLELAMLLGVSRSQFSMFELGKRDLPLHAMQLLGEMLTYIQSPEVAAKSALPDKPKASLPQLERLQRKNHYQQLLTERKIATATKKLQAQARLLQLSAFLSSRKGSSATAIRFPTVLARKTNRATEAPLLELIVEQQLRKELLELENLLLESRLLKLRSDA